jgi:bifunctional non-homologous end joining protein LigD
METTTLYFKEGSSDKVYQASIVQRGDGYVVQIAYGRRGTTLTTGTKTPTPVSEAEANRICEKLIQSKLAKGYQTGKQGSAYLVRSHKQTDVRPQLLNSVESTGLERLISSNAFVLEEKFDGKRLLLRKTGDVLVGVNRRGIECGVPAPIASAVMALAGDFLIDGEAVGDIYHVFDLLEADGIDWRPQQYRDRLSRLGDLIRGKKNNALQWVPREHFKVPKRIRLRQLRDARAEGVVFKRLSAPYKPGRPNSGGDQFKYKFVETASVVVTEINACRSVGIGVWEKGVQKPAGNVTIPPNQPVPAVGAVAEVRYLYAMPGSGALFQPVYLGERDDIDPSECTSKQLKFKAEPASQAA